MRLSDAIRLGSTLRPQAFGGLVTMVKTDGQAPVIGSCAMGAAAEALGIITIDVNGHADVDTPAYERWWASFRAPLHLYSCPDPKCTYTNRHSMCLNTAVVHLNDAHCWTREAIADWVATVEPLESAPIEEPQPQPDEEEVPIVA